MESPREAFDSTRRETNGAKSRTARRRASAREPFGIVDLERIAKRAAQMLAQSGMVEWNLSLADADGELAAEVLHVAVMAQQRDEAVVFGGGVRRAHLEFPPHDVEGVGGDAGFEAMVPAQRRHQLLLEVLDGGLKNQGGLGDAEWHGGKTLVTALQKFVEIPQRLFDSPPDRASLDTDFLDAAHAEPEASGGPFDASERFPEADVSGIDRLSSRLFVGFEQFLAPAEASDREFAAEAPRLHAQPSEILHRITDLPYFPIEDEADSVVLSDDHVADAEVAVDDGQARVPGNVVGGPFQTPFEGRQMEIVVVDDLALPLDHLGGGLTMKIRGFGERDAVDAGEDLSRLPRHLRSRRRESGFAQYLRRERFTVHAVGDVAGAEAVGVVEDGADAGGGHAHFRRRHHQPRALLGGRMGRYLGERIGLVGRDLRR